MKMFLLGFLICYVLSCVVVTISDPLNEGLAKVWMAPGIAVAVVVIFPFFILYRLFLYNTIKPREKENLIRVAKVTEDYSVRRVFGKVYLWHDKDATKFFNRFFFVRSTEPLTIKNHRLVF